MYRRLNIEQVAGEEEDVDKRNSGFQPKMEGRRIELTLICKPSVLCCGYCCTVTASESYILHT